jgi:hypothetical protein
MKLPYYFFAAVFILMALICIIGIFYFTEIIQICICLYMLTLSVTGLLCLNTLFGPYSNNEDL